MSCKIRITVGNKKIRAIRDSLPEALAPWAVVSTQWAP